MSADVDVANGQRLRSLRERKGFSRETLASLAEVSPSTIKSIEMGRRGLTLKMASRLAPLLDVRDYGQFFGEHVSLPTEARASHPAVPEVRRALTSWGIAIDGRPERAEYLRGLVDTAWQTWHTSEHQRTEIGRILPGLLTAAQRSARLTESEQERREVLAISAQTYHLAQAFLAHHGERELVYLTVDRGMSTALESEHPLAIGSSVFYAAHVLRAVGRSDEAIANLAEARELVGRHNPDSTHATGSRPEDWPAMMADLWRCSAVTKARAGDQGAWADWGEAESIVRQLPDGYVHPWTRTSRIIVEVEGVMIAADLGDADEVRRRAQAIDPATIPSTDRRARHLVELARGASMEGSPEAVLHLLSQASLVSAETVAYTPAGRDLTEKLLRESGATTRATTHELARRIGLELP